MQPRTMYEKIWEAHLVREAPGEPSLIYIDRHLIHEGTSPQAFAGLKAAGRKVRRPDLTFAVMDHSVPTKDRSLPVLDTVAAAQFDALAQNCRETGVLLFDMRSRNQGIVHIIGPELGITQPGQTIVCVDGQRPRGVTAKDLILATIGKIGIAGGNGHVIEYAGEAIRALSMEGRMTVCNMSIEAGARAGMIAPDDTTIAYMEGRPFVPRGKDFKEAAERWKSVA